MKQIVKESNRWIVKEAEKLLRPNAASYGILKSFFTLNKNVLSRKEILNAIDDNDSKYMQWSEMTLGMTFQKLLKDGYLMKPEIGFYEITDTGKKLFKRSELSPNLSVTKNVITTLPNFSDMSELPRKTSSDIIIKNATKLTSLQNSPEYCSGEFEINAPNITSFDGFKTILKHKLHIIGCSKITSLQSLKLPKSPRAFIIVNTPVKSMLGIEWMGHLWDLIIAGTDIVDLVGCPDTEFIRLDNNRKMISFEGIHPSIGTIEISNCSKDLTLQGFPKKLWRFQYDKTFPFSEAELLKVCKIERIDRI